MYRGLCGQLPLGACYALFGDKSNDTFKHENSKGICLVLLHDQKADAAIFSIYLHVSVSAPSPDKTLHFTVNSIPAPYKGGRGPFPRSFITLRCCPQRPGPYWQVTPDNGSGGTSFRGFSTYCRPIALFISF